MITLIDRWERERNLHYTVLHLDHDPNWKCIERKKCEVILWKEKRVQSNLKWNSENECQVMSHFESCTWKHQNFIDEKAIKCKYSNLMCTKNKLCNQNLICYIFSKFNTVLERRRKCSCELHFNVPRLCSMHAQHVRSL